MSNTTLAEVVQGDLGEQWITYIDSAYDYYGRPGGLKKNPIAIARALKTAWENELKSDTLVNLVKSIIDFSKGTH